MSTVWFTSDTHFGHANICKGCSTWEDKDSCRDFATTEDHDNQIIDNINKLVKPADILYHLGDFGFGFNKVERFKEIRNLIKCETIYLILGNHDHVFDSHSKYSEELKTLFKKIYHLLYKSINKQNIVMCHYAMRTWPWQGQGSWQLYGHSHSNLPDLTDQLTLDVGLDTYLYNHVKYTPYSFDELKQIMSTKSFKKVDHH